jgi:putative protease
LGGIDNQALVHGRFGKKRGVYLGTVTAVHRDRVTVLLEGPLKPGDGVVFDAGRPQEPEEGGRVFEVRTAECNKGNVAPAPRWCPDRHRRQENRRPAEVVLSFGNGVIDFSRIGIGDRIWKTSDPVLEKQWRQSYAGEQPRFQRAVWMEVHGCVHQALTLIVRDEFGHVARVDSVLPLSSALKQPCTTRRLQEQLGRLGGTPYRLEALENRLEGDVMLPLGELNRLRRAAVAELDRQRAQPRRWTLTPAPARHRTPGSTSLDSRGDPAELIVLVRSLKQLEAAVNSGAQTVYCDFENPKRYREAVAFCRAAQPSSGNGEAPVTPSQPAIYVAPPRIFKPDDEWQLQQVRSSNADGYLVRNYDHLRFFARERCVGDFSLNVANHLSADYFMHRFGLERVTASYDLNVDQLAALLRGAPPEWFEITLHQHMPMFHMEHCVFCAFLSKGKDYRDCGRPCDRHDLRLRDRVGAEHPVKADVGCRNTVFNARAQTGAEYFDRLRALGARRFRVEFLQETVEEVTRTLAAYRRLLRGEISGPQVWRELRVVNQLGVTRGTVTH